MKIPDLSIIEKTLNNEATSEESCEVVRWFKTPEGQAWLAERIDQDEKTIHMGEEEAWIDHPIPSAVMYQNIMRQLRRQKIRRFIAYAAAVFIPIALIIGLFIRINSQVDLLADDGYDEVYVPNGERMQVLFQDGSKVHLNSGSRIRYPKKFGLSERKVYLKHAFRNALIPVTVLLCFRIPGLVGGSVVIESVFGWPGMGGMLLDAISGKDYPVVMITAMIIAFVTLIASFLADLFTTLLDPRVDIER